MSNSKPVIRTPSDETHYTNKLETKIEIAPVLFCFCDKQNKSWLLKWKKYCIYGRPEISVMEFKRINISEKKYKRYTRCLLWCTTVVWLWWEVPKYSPNTPNPESRMQWGVTPGDEGRKQTMGSGIALGRALFSIFENLLENIENTFHIESCASTAVICTQKLNNQEKLPWR
jgi:hypothetical protein